MSLSVTLLKTPYTISLTGNPMPFIWNVNPFGGDDENRNITLTVRVLLENTFKSGVFEEIYLQKLFPVQNGDITLDVRTILSAYLQYFTPRIDMTAPVEALQQRKRYKVSYLLQENDQAVGTTEESPVLFALKGGLAYEAWHYKNFFEKVILEDKKPLHFYTRKEKCSAAALKYIYWIYPFDDVAEQTVTYTIFYDDLTTFTKTSDPVISGQWSVCCAPAGIAQLGETPAKNTVKYSIKVTTESETIVEECFFNVDSRNFYEPYFILFRNSLGALETVRLTGSADISADYDRQQVQRTVPPSYYNPHLIPQLQDEATEESLGFSADTGWFTKEEMDNLRDLFLGKEKYLHRQDRLIPLVIDSKKVKFYSNKDSLKSTSIDFKYAFVNSSYTPEALMPALSVCPAVEKFLVTQLTKDKLQILWALEIPYNSIEVKITIGADVITYNYSGNTGKIIQPFTNPATTDPVDITITGRTICNPETVPVDLGPATTIILSVVGNSLPVAVDDYIVVPSGFLSNYQVPGSLLDNDYDPDGDPIECAPANAQTALSGVIYQLTKEGKVTFLTQFYNNKNDYFNYQIHNVGSGTYVSARCNIQIGERPTVYAKTVNRNIVENRPSGWWTITADVYIEFYSDPAGTVPLDISNFGLGLINYQKVSKTINQHGDTTGTASTENLSIQAAGNRVIIHTGFILAYYTGSGSKLEFTVKPGTGYTAI